MCDQATPDGDRVPHDQELDGGIRSVARVVVRSMVGQRPNRELIAEEIAQSVAIELFRLGLAHRRLDGRDRNKLICVVARRRCVDWLRRDARERASPLPTTVPLNFDESRFPSFTESIAAMTRTPSSILGWREIGAFAVDAIGRLPDNQREPIILFLFGGMKTAEIAQTVGGNRTAVANRVKRGLLQLRDELRRAFPDVGFTA